MTIYEICESIFPIRMSYSRKKCSRIFTKRKLLKEAIEEYASGGHKPDGIRFANWLQKNEFSPTYGNVNWMNVAGEYIPIEQLYEQFIADTENKE